VRRAAAAVALIACLAACMAASARATLPSKTFGDTALEPFTFTFIGNEKRAFKFFMPEAGTITKLTLRGTSGGAHLNHLKGLVYADLGTAPGAKLGEGQQITLAAHQSLGDVDLTFSTGIHVSSARYLWLGYIAESSNGSTRYANTGTQAISGDTYSNGASDPFGTPNVVDSHQFGIYATYTPDAIYDQPVPRYGISPGYNILNRTSAMQDFEIDQIVRVGAKLIRLDDIATSPAEEAKTDAVVSKALARGLEPELNLGGTEPYPWAVSSTTFGQACSEVATKYHEKVRYYEVLNEPNGSWNGWTAAGYVPYLQACHDAIKAVDTRNVVLLGGIAPAANISPVSWVQQLYAAGAKPYFDVMNLHLYSDPANPLTWSIWQQTFGPNVVPNVRSVMSDNGDSAKQVISTEGNQPVGQPQCGAPSYNTVCTESDQADIVSRTLSDSRITQSYILAMLDDVAQGFGLEVQDPSGTIVDPTGTHWRRRPAFESMRSITGGTG
jgi:polysaccharide biosynthesis protein PslG